MNAILFARYADHMADNISKITGREYTAEDYMRKRTSIVADATEVDESEFKNAMNREYFPIIKEFDKAFWVASKKSKIGNWIKNKKSSHTLKVGDMVSQNRIMSNSFINIIQNMFDIVISAYNQTAYHGSPHTFDTLDLGVIRTGKDRQAHG